MGYLVSNSQRTVYIHDTVAVLATVQFQLRVNVPSRALIGIDRQFYVTKMVDCAIPYREWTLTFLLEAMGHCTGLCSVQLYAILIGSIAT